MITAGLDPGKVFLFDGIVPLGDTVLLRQLSGNVDQNRVNEPGVDLLRGIGGNGGKAAALGAVVIAALPCREGGHGPLIAAGGVFTDGPLIFIRNTGFEHHFLCNRFCVLEFRQVALIVHLTQHVQLTPAVPLTTGPLLTLILINGFGIGIEQRGVVGNTDQAGAFRNRQTLQLLAKILGSSTLDTVAALAQVDPVQIFLQDQILVVFPFKYLGTENFHHLSLNGNTLFLGNVLHQLLGNGGAAEVGVAAEEHVDAGFHRGNPVNTLMLVKPLVLNGNGGIDQRLGNVLQLRPLAVNGCGDLLQQLNLAVTIHVISKGSFLNIIVADGPVSSLRQDVLLQIVTQGANKDNSTDQSDQHNRQCGADGDLKNGKHHRPKGVDNLQQPVGIPLLPGFLRSPFLIFVRHSHNLQYRASCCDTMNS